MQAFILHDKKFVRSNTSNPVEFVCAVEKRKKFFKKVSSPTDKSFLVPQTGRSYEQQLTNIERFFIRSNSILAEFIMLYDFCGSEETKNFSKLFQLKEWKFKTVYLTVSPLKNLYQSS